MPCPVFIWAKICFLFLIWSWPVIISLFCRMEGSHLRVASCLLFPAVQLVVGISHPSWISLPFFIGSCVGLVDWSLTSNFLGLFRWWFDFVSLSNNVRIISIFRIYFDWLLVNFVAYGCLYGIEGGGGLFSCMLPSTLSFFMCISSL